MIVVNSSPPKYKVENCINRILSEYKKDPNVVYSETKIFIFEFKYLIQKDLFSLPAAASVELMYADETFVKTYFMVI